MVVRCKEQRAMHMHNTLGLLVSKLLTVGRKVPGLYSYISTFHDDGTGMARQNKELNVDVTELERKGWTNGWTALPFMRYLLWTWEHHFLCIFTSLIVMGSQTKTDTRVSVSNFQDRESFAA